MIEASRQAREIVLSLSHGPVSSVCVPISRRRPNAILAKWFIFITLPMSHCQSLSLAAHSSNTRVRSSKNE